MNAGHDGRYAARARMRHRLQIGGVLVLLGLLVLGALYFYIHTTNITAEVEQERLHLLWEEAMRTKRFEMLASAGAVARLKIEQIGVDVIVTRLESFDDEARLRCGAGLLPETPVPGEEGNAVIAGHRTTYGAPFARIMELGPGSEVIAETADGVTRYTVKSKVVIDKNDVSVLDQGGENRITMFACHPPHSSAQRIVVVASRVP